MNTWITIVWLPHGNPVFLNIIKIFLTQTNNKYFLFNIDMH